MTFNEQSVLRAKAVFTSSFDKKALIAHSVTNKLNATVILRGKDKAEINDDRGIVKRIQKKRRLKN